MNRGSQFGEIKWASRNLALPAIGTFVEVGASDGLENSNTVELEDRGWRGVLIEPHPRSAEKLYAHRPLAKIVQCAVASTERDDAEFFLNDDPTWSGLLEGRSLGHSVPIVQRRLDNVLAELHIDRVDLLSIDTEGTELDAWASRGSFNPRVVIIEFLTAGLPSNSDAIAETFARDGYRLVHTTEVNHIFLRDNS